MIQNTKHWWLSYWKKLKKANKLINKYKTMKVGTSWANKAYNETRKNGGTKEEARIASKEAREEYIQHVINQQARHSGDDCDCNIYDEDHEVNDGGWHTGSDL